MPINSLPAQVCELQDSHVRLCPGHFPPELSLLIILVLILMRVPPPQCAEQSPLSQLLHSQFIGVSWIEYNVHNISYNINLFLITTILNISTNLNTYEYNFRTTSCRNFWPVDFVTIWDLISTALAHWLRIALPAFFTSCKTYTGINSLTICS